MDEKEGDQPVVEPVSTNDAVVESEAGVPCQEVTHEASADFAQSDSVQSSAEQVSENSAVPDGEVTPTAVQQTSQSDVQQTSQSDVQQTSQSDMQQTSQPDMQQTSPSDMRQTSQSDRQQTSQSDRQQTSHSDRPPDYRKLFVGGLTLQTTDDGLKTYYSQFGDVVDCIVMRDPNTQRSRGFGFVTFADTSQLDAAMKQRPHIIDGKSIDPKRAVPREMNTKIEAQVSVKKLYVSGIKDDHTEEQLTEYFSQYGNITEVEIVEDKQTGNRKGFAFITFDDYDPVDKAIIEKTHEIGEHTCEVKKALSKDEMRKVQQQERDREERGDRSRSYGPRRGGRGDYRGARGGGGGGRYSDGYYGDGGYNGNQYGGGYYPQQQNWGGGGSGWNGNYQGQQSWQGGGGSWGNSADGGWGQQQHNGGYGGGYNGGYGHGQGGWHSQGQQQSGNWGQQQGGWGQQNSQHWQGQGQGYQQYSQPGGTSDGYSSYGGGY